MTPLEFLRTGQAGEQLAYLLADIDVRPERNFPDPAHRGSVSPFLMRPPEKVPHFHATWWLTWTRVELHTQPPMQRREGLSALLDTAIYVMVAPRHDDQYMMMDGASTASTLRLLSRCAPNLDSPLYSRLERAAFEARIPIGPALTLWNRLPAAELVTGVLGLFLVAHEAVGS